LVCSQSFPHLWKKLWKFASFRPTRTFDEGHAELPDRMNLWEEVLARVETKVNRHSFYTWFKPTTFLAEDAGAITVRVPNTLFKDWLTKHYSGVIGEAMSEVHKATLAVNFVADPQNEAVAIPLGPEEAATLDQPAPIPS
jgi:chromosomal replication initiation ATPase DnaA